MDLNVTARVNGLSQGVLSFFIQDLREGGAERNVARLLNGVVARGVPTELVVIERRGSFFDELDRRVRVVELAQKRTMTSVLGLKRYIEQRRPVALVSSLTHTNVAAILANRLARPRTRLIVVERNQFSLNRQLKRGLVRFAYQMVPRLYCQADFIGAVSEGVRDDLADTAHLPLERIEVLHNPVVSEGLAEKAGEPIDHPWLQPGQPPVVLGVGRLSTQKNFPLLIDAFARVRAKRPARLIILGEGSLRPELEKRIEALGIAEDVDLPGFDANPFRYMRHAAVFVLSSDWEGLPTALIEAMACGTPVVSTDCQSGPREVLLDGRLGPIVPRGDARALAEAILATISHPGDYSARLERANDFSLERAVDRYLSITGVS